MVKLGNFYWAHKYCYAKLLRSFCWGRIRKRERKREGWCWKSKTKTRLNAMIYFSVFFNFRYLFYYFSFLFSNATFFMDLWIFIQSKIVLCRDASTKENLACIFCSFVNSLKWEIKLNLQFFEAQMTFSFFLSSAKHSSSSVYNE